ncbi:MAG: phosphatase PAP2 family protein [Marinibacterium sp.]
MSHWDPSDTVGDPGLFPGNGQTLRYLASESQTLTWASALNAHFGISGPGVETVGETEFAYGASFQIRDGVRFLIGVPPIDFFKAQMVHVRSYADLRHDRLVEIQEQVHDILSFFGALCQVDDGRRRGTMAFLNVAHSVAIEQELLIKHYCLRPRPIDYDPHVFPIIQTPDHSCYPAGHAIEAFTLATVVHYLMTGESANTGIASKALPFRLAARIAANRIIAGVHFPVDNLVGAQIGCMIGNAVLGLSGQTVADPRPVGTLTTALDRFHAADDFLLDTLAPDGPFDEPAQAFVTPVDPLAKAQFDESVAPEWVSGTWQP